MHPRGDTELRAFCLTLLRSHRILAGTSTPSDPGGKGSSWDSASLRVAQPTPRRFRLQNPCFTLPDVRISSWGRGNKEPSLFGKTTQHKVRPESQEHESTREAVNGYQVLMTQLKPQF